jgi:hypothetical protein
MFLKGNIRVVVGLGTYMDTSMPELADVPIDALEAFLL